MACSYCYNVDLYNDEGENISAEACEEFIDSRVLTNDKGKEFYAVEYIAFSGGECTLHNDFLPLLYHAKEKGFKTAVYTNGTSPGVLQEAFKHNWIDFLSIDYKWKYLHPEYPERRFLQVLDSIKLSFKEYRKNSLEYFRINTTLLKSYHYCKNLESMKGQLEYALSDVGFTDEIPIILRKKAAKENYFCWTFESFFNDNGKIPTLGNIQGEEITDSEMEEIIDNLRL
jgi:pyruvate formate lyase activating enzyme